MEPVLRRELNRGQALAGPERQCTLRKAESSLLT
jgi:hypothetical protein